jgi:hypothetical protein
MNRRTMIHLSILAVLAIGVANSAKFSSAQEPELAGDPIVATSVIWEECWEKKVFDKNVKACARLLDESSKFYLELEIAGKRKKWEIANKCYESDRISIGVVEAWLKHCLSDIKIEGNQLKSVKVTAHICGKAFGQSDCWKVYEDTIKFFYTDAKSTSPAAYVTASDQAAAVKTK